MEQVKKVKAVEENTFIDTITMKTQLPIFRLLQALALIAAGVFFLFSDYETVKNVTLYALAIFFIGFGIWHCMKGINEDRILYAVIILSISNILAAALLIFFDDIMPVLNIILAVLVFLIAFLRISIVIFLISVKGPKIARNIFSAIILIILGILLLILKIDTKISASIIFTIIGFYLIFFGVTFLGDFIASLSRSDLKKNRSKRRSHFSLPNVITAYQSTQIVHRYDKVLENNPELTKQVTLKSDSTDRDVNFDIMIHVSQILAKRMGHVDIAIGDTVYTYGCYDPRYNKLGGMISRGTFCILPKDPYIKNCLSQQRKYVIDYGCHLSDEQMQAIQEKIKEIFSHTSESDIKYDPAQDVEGNDGVNTVAKLGGQLYYVDEGPFKTYYAIASNCVQLADTIIGTAGFDIMSGNSLRTPGAYYRMMENMFKRKGTRVVKKTVYLQNEPGEKARLKAAAKEKAKQKKEEKKAAKQAK